MGRAFEALAPVVATLLYGCANLVGIDDEERREVEVQFTGDGEGAITIAPGQFRCEQNCSVFAAPGVGLRAEASTVRGWMFVDWTEGCSGFAELCDVPDGSPVIRGTFRVAEEYAFSTEGLVSKLFQDQTTTINIAYGPRTATSQFVGAVDIDTTEKLWETVLPGNGQVNSQTVDDTVVVWDDTSGLRGLDIRDGSETWTWAPPLSPDRGVEVQPSTIVIAHETGVTAYPYPVGDTTPSWTYAPPNIEVLGLLGGGYFVFVHETALDRFELHYVTGGSAFDTTPLPGQTIVSLEVAGVEGNCTPSACFVVYVLYVDDLGAFKVSQVARDGSIGWTVDVSERGSVGVVNDRVFVAIPTSSSTTVRRLDPATGADIWSREVPIRNCSGFTSSSFSVAANAANDAFLGLSTGGCTEGELSRAMFVRIPQSG